MQKTDIELLKSLLIKKETVNSESKSLEVKNTAECLHCRIKSVESNKLSQKSYTGKNQINFNNIDQKNLYGILFTPIFLDGLLDYITIKGTCTKDFFAPCAIDISNLAEGDYIISGLGANNTIRYTLLKQKDTEPLLFNSDGDHAFTQNASSPYVRLRIDVYNTNEIDTIVKPMIRKASVTENSYEPYVGGQASPNSDYAQEVEGITGDVTGRVRSKNLVDMNRFLSDRIISRTNNFIIAKYTSTYQGAGKISIDLSAEKYIFSADIPSNTGAVELRFYKNNTLVGNPIVVQAKYSFDNTNKIYDYVEILLGNINYIGNVSFKNIQLEEGTKVTDYVERKSRDIALSLGSKTLYKGDKIVYRNGKWQWAWKYGKHRLRSTDNLSYNSEYKRVYANINNIDILAVVPASNDIAPTIKCNYLKTMSATSFLADTTKDGITISSSSVLSIRNTKCSSQSEYDNWLDSEDVYVVYQRNEITYEDITNATLLGQLNKILLNLKEYDEKTYIEFDQDVLFEIEVERDRLEITEDEITEVKTLVLEGGNSDV